MAFHTCNCGGLEFPKMPHLHAENCPEREKDFPLFRENIVERRMFDRATENLFKSDPLRQVAASLDTWGRIDKGGSFAEQCFIMANECLIASQRIKELEAELAEAYQSGEQIS